MKVELKKTFLLVIAIFSLVILSSLAGFVAKYPLQVAESLFEAQMKMDGTSSQNLRKMRVLTKDTCEFGKDCECVVFIHGLGDQAITWRKIFSQAQPNSAMKMFAVDLPGSGKSPGLESEDYRVTELAGMVKRDVLPLCDSWTVVGNSFGGWVATELALENPTTVKKLMLLNSAGVAFDYNELVSTFMDPNIERIRAFEKRSWYSIVPKPDFIYTKVAERWMNMPVGSYLMSQIDEPLLDEARLSAIKQPVFIMWGESDQLIPISVGEAFARFIPHSTFSSQERCGHMPQQECAEVVWSNLNKFIHN